MSTTLIGRASIDGREVDVRLRRSSSARFIRIRVGPRGVEVICPEGRSPTDAETFLRENSAWVTSQLDRIVSVRSVGRTPRIETGEILFEGLRRKICIDVARNTSRSNRIYQSGDTLNVVVASGSTVAPARSLERWLRKEARRQIEDYVAVLRGQLKTSPRRIYIMDQRTKWANCSRRRNLSFSWRIVMAPEFVLQYLVTHEMVHLVVPDHSHRFWLTVQSLCRDAERARQWLAANGQKLYIDLDDLFEAVVAETSKEPTQARS